MSNEDTISPAPPIPAQLPASPPPPPMPPMLAESRRARRSFDHPQPVDTEHIHTTGSRLRAATEQWPRGGYRLEDVAAVLRSDAAALATPRAAFVGEQYVINGLAWMGAEMTGAGDGRAVWLLSPEELDRRDHKLLGRAAAQFPEEVTVRRLQRSCRWSWVTAWSLRGSVDRLVAAGELLRHPGCRREVATVWQVAGINVP